MVSIKKRTKVHFFLYFDCIFFNKKLYFLYIFRLRFFNVWDFRYKYIKYNIE